MAGVSVNLQNLNELIATCFVPVLKDDLDDVPLQSEHFNEYRNNLELQLPILYDFLQQNRQRVFENEEKEACEALAHLLVLLCEITARTTIYQLSDESIQRNANRILREHTPIKAPAVEEIVFAFYQKKLGKPAWKKQIGTLYGFLQFIQIQFYGRSLPEQWVHFCLSVGLTVRESHEPVCKRIGISIFQLILNCGTFSYLQEQNIHSVIYDSASKDVDFLDSVEIATDVWNCLYKSLDFHKDLDGFNWSQLDDLLEKALKNITMAPNSLISLCHLQFVTKIGSYFAINHKEIETHCQSDLNNSIDLEHCRNICATNNSFTAYRWAKDILNMFVVNSYKLMQDKKFSQIFLLEVHKCYLVYILPIQLQIIGPLLIPFLEKFTAVLMEVINTHRRDFEIIKSIRAILETFKLQLHSSTYRLENEDFGKLYKALVQLLAHNVFVQNI